MSVPLSMPWMVARPLLDSLRTPGCLQWSNVSIGGSGSAERCAELASALSARRLPAASPCDTAAVTKREPKPKSCKERFWLVNIKSQPCELETMPVHLSALSCVVWPRRRRHDVAPGASACSLHTNNSTTNTHKHTG